MLKETVKLASDVRAYGLSEKGQAEDKLNEDAFSIDLKAAVATVADGVTRPRRRDESYPSEEGVIAPCLFKSKIPDVLRSASASFAEEMRRAFQVVNKAIWEENKRRFPDAPDFVYEDYLSTVGVAWWLPPVSNSAVLGYIGDCMAFYLPYGGRPRMLTVNQLEDWNRYNPSYDWKHSSHWELSSVEAERRCGFWRRKHIRNKKDAYGPDGTPVSGYGDLTGEAVAIDFVEIVTVNVSPGDRFVLASDALGACADCADNTSENVTDYAGLLVSVRDFKPEECAGALFWKPTLRCECCVSFVPCGDALVSPTFRSISLCLRTN